MGIPRSISAVVACLALWLLPALVHADCPQNRGELDPNPNVYWTFRDSIIACPSGDSTVWSTDPHKPCQLRILISYYDDNCDPKVGVPPESIYVIASNYSGNATVNDQPKIYADDATDDNGTARVTIRSMSGAGRIKIRIFVSGVEQDGYSLPHVRTTDTDADGRTTSSDATSMADLNYNGVTNEFSELLSLSQHVDHWHRNVLYGTAVQRTNFASAYYYGEGFLDWDPSDRRLVYSGHHGCNNDCVLDTLSVDGGGAPSQFTFPACREDYDPSWSPRGHEIIFVRSGTSVFRKGAISPDTLQTLIAYVPDSTTTVYTDADVSPNSRKVAFVKLLLSNSTGNIYTVGIQGDSLTQITSLSNTAIRWPRWSSDGQFIYFGAYSGSDPFALYKVSVASGTVSLVDSSGGRHEKAPNPSPDGATMVFSRQAPSGFLNYPTTIDPALSDPKPIAYFADHPTSYAMFPAYSYDGTRLAFVGKPSSGTSDGYEEVLVTRRNMSKPPALGAIGDRVVEVNDELAFTISASDPESDALTYSAKYLETGMSFSPSTREFSWTPGEENVGHSYWVVFRVTTPSGGTDAEVVKISVIEDGFRADLRQEALAPRVVSDGSSFAIEATGTRRDAALLQIYSISGRRIASISGTGGSTMRWAGNDSQDRRVPPGVYLYRLVVGETKAAGKIVLVRTSGR